MSSTLYRSFLADVLSGRIDVGQDTFRMMLVTTAYRPDASAHRRRSDVAGDEVPAAHGYKTGGVPVSVKLTENEAGVELSFGPAIWKRATITARGCLLYKARGGDAGGDELVMHCDFGKDTTSTDASFEVECAAPLQFSSGQG